MTSPIHSVPKNGRGRDLVVGDAHGCFRTLDRVLSELGFDASRDRLFGVGDVVNRGPHSEEALAWLENRFHAVTMGNHERPIRDWFRAKLLRGRPRSLPWLRRIPSAHYQRWVDALDALPLALTIETSHGAVGVIHAQVPDPDWDRALKLLSTGSRGIADIALLGHLPRNLACLTNLAISIVRLKGRFDSIPQAHRHYARRPQDAVRQLINPPIR